MKGNLEVNQQRMAGPISEGAIGLDLGDRWSRYCVIDGKGVVAKEDRVRTNPRPWKRRSGRAGSAVDLIASRPPGPAWPTSVFLGFLALKPKYDQLQRSDKRVISEVCMKYPKAGRSRVYSHKMKLSCPR
jgi:hypothetical protein